ncbi:D-amino-acid oxidase [Hyphodiscus hymeniophilus]|uniref:D-amino-acid oxidase n=1 Tax=Hyphodiscus hymeniophilus TaxID=353542 RepID=A0A9P6VGT0_9HELO|nr:D-amino-acid oxidase [Hyphodiscus hymeniophilus]
MTSNLAPPRQKHIIILGAGITALSTSLALHNLKHIAKSSTPFAQTIIAAHLPGDSSIDYTSPWAGGHWRSHASTADLESESRLRKWDKRTYEVWMEMLEDGRLSEDEINDLGLGIRESRNYWAKETAETTRDGSGLWWSKERELESDDEPVDSRSVKAMKGGGVKDFAVLDLASEKSIGVENIPDGAVFGIKYTTVCINIPQYLSHRFRSAKDRGTTVIKDTVDTSAGIEGVVKDAKRILISQNREAQEEDIFAVINCTGLGARHFVGDEESAKLYPVRGQTILVKGEALKARSYVEFGEGTEEDELLYVIPRPGSGTTILGGCKQKGNWSGDVDKVLNGRILQRAKEYGLAEELRTGNGREFEVLGFQVGLRPGREGGPRMEAEKRKVDETWLVHSYGHSGGGYQCSAGCGEEVAEIVLGLEHEVFA